MKKSLLLAPLFVSAQVLALPQILSYFPGCDYQQYDTVKAQGEVETNHGSGEYETSLRSVLKRLRGAAAEQGAEALVITNLKVHSRELMDRSFERISNQLYKYTALPIDLCDSEDKSLRQLADYDHRGQPVINFNLTAKKKRKVALEVVFPVARSLLTDEEMPDQQGEQRPGLKHHQVSIEQGLYGVKLGQNRDEVIQQFGYPSAEFRLFEDTQSVLYGRRHWLHFQQGKLVMAEFTDGYLAFNLLNEIPPLPGFDNFSWRLSKANIADKASLSEVQKALPKGRFVSQSSDFMLNQGDTRLSIKFDIAHNNRPNADTTPRFVSGFRLYTNDTKLIPVSLDKTIDYQLVTDFIQRLDHQQSVDVAQLIPKFGEPLGRVFHSHRGHLDVFDNHMVLEINRPRAARLHFYQQVFSKQLASGPEQGWKLTSDLHQGASLNTIRQSLGQHLQVAHGGIFLSGERYDMQLYLDGENAQAKLHSAEVTLY